MTTKEKLAVAEELLHETLQAVNLKARFKYHYKGEATDSYALASKLDKYFREG